MALKLNQDLFRKFVINLREETTRLFGQTIDEARAAAFVALFFKSDKTVAFEKAQVAAHAHLRYFQFSGQLPHAHRAVDLQQINNRAAGLFEDVLDGGYCHSPIIEGGA